MVDVERGLEKNPQKDRVRVWPGRFLPARLQKADPSGLKIRRTLGGNKTRLVQFENGHWQLRVNDAPFVVRGVTYDATVVGQSPHDGSLHSWMKVDHNQNGLSDGPYDSWVDANRNDIQDPDEPVVGDAALMAQMGVNTIRYYHSTLKGGAYDPSQFDKELLRTFHHQYGISVVMSDFFGAYTQGSGASWNLGTDYTDAAQQQRMLESVRRMVEDHRDEPYVLFWMLGNETHSRLGSHLGTWLFWVW
jgi:beta-glucuronidase